jgi:two-component system, sensor histidine kinase and response regulator
MSKPTILVVEDDVHLVEGIRDILEVNGYEVLVATNGLKGLEVLRQQSKPPDLILSDIMMPRMDGYEFLEAVREHKPWVSIPFIFLTAKGERDDITRARKMGVEDYVVKPFDADELLVTVYAKLDQFIKVKEVWDNEVSSIKHNILTILNHEFRTPLTYVVAYADMLDRDASDLGREDMLAFLRGINAGASRLRRLVENFILLVELETGEAAQNFKLRQGPLSDYAALLSGVKAKYQELADEKRIKIEVQVAPSLPTIRADAEYLRAALECLVDNAIKFTSKFGTTITLRADRAEDNQLCFSVQDQGRGVPEHEHDQIWDILYQINREKYEDQGAGSGLAIVRGVAQLHGREPDLDSVFGEGSTFKLFIPLPERRNEDLTRWSATRLRKKPTLLVVEDDANLVDGMRDILEVNGYTVLTAKNGQQGLDILRSQPKAPDLILSDIMMPVMDGYEFLKKLREQSAWLQIPFIFLTAKGERADVKFARSMGIEDYVIKPFDAESLLSTVYGTLKRWDELGSAWRSEVAQVKQSILTILDHEFRTPLMFMVAYSTLLNQDANDLGKDDMHEFLRGINVGANRLRRLVENFILLVELETGEARNTFGWRQGVVTNYSALLRTIQSKYREMADGRQVRLDVNVIDPLPPIKADLEYLTAAVECLVDNAIKFSNRPHSTVRMSAYLDGSQVCLSVRDEGRGIPEQELENIFQSFDQVERKKYEDQGAGSGLAIVDGVIRLHGGSIAVESVYGQGSTFTLRLPVFKRDNGSTN